MSRQADHAQHHPCRRHLRDKYHRRNICHHHHRHTTLIIQHCNSCQMLETTAPIAAFLTGQGIVPHPKVGRAGAAAGGGGVTMEGHHGGGGYHGGGVGAPDPRAYIHPSLHACIHKVSCCIPVQKPSLQSCRSCCHNRKRPLGTSMGLWPCWVRPSGGAASEEIQR